MTWLSSKKRHYASKKGICQLPNELTNTPCVREHQATGDGVSLDINRMWQTHSVESKRRTCWQLEFGCFRKSFVLSFVGGAEIEC